MSLYSVGYLIVGFLFLAVGVFSVLQNKKNKLFFLFSFLMWVWLIFLSLLFNNAVKNSSLIIKISYIAKIYVPAVMLHFVVLFLNAKKGFLWT